MKFKYILILVFLLTPVWVLLSELTNLPVTLTVLPTCYVMFILISLKERQELIESNFSSFSWVNTPPYRPSRYLQILISRNIFFKLAIKDILFNNFKVHPNSYVLDAGCGKGWYDKFFTKGMGIDNSIERLKVAEAENPHFRYYEMDITKTSLSEESFELALCLGVLHQLQNPEKAVKEIYRLLKNNGTLILEVPTDNPPLTQKLLYPIYKLLGVTYFEKGVFTIESLEYWKDLLINNGFKMERILFQGKFWFCLFAYFGIQLNENLDKKEKCANYIFKCRK